VTSNVTINPKTIAVITIRIEAQTETDAGCTFGSIFSPLKGVLLLLVGVLIGFGTRYAGGCTSGHAISGLSNLQIPSLKAVIGFWRIDYVLFFIPLIF
jgi:uncharacterized membrane protein YedE/YeeE